jgi:nicotinate-nucleotide adenylyltransferase
VELISRPVPEPRRLAILPGSFNPPTVAHLELARAALAANDAVLFVLPRRFPHKQYHGASLEERIDMIARCSEHEPRFAVAVSDGGLFIDIARECRSLWPSVGIDFLCGRDAAERIAAWDYGEADGFEAQLDEFGLLVAPRAGEFDVPSGLAHRIRKLPPGLHETVSSTEVRRRIGAAEEWSSLVPPPIHDLVASIYTSL